MTEVKCSCANKVFQLIWDGGSMIDRRLAGGNENAAFIDMTFNTSLRQQTLIVALQYGA